jgi:hypothetical protein
MPHIHKLVLGLGGAAAVLAASAAIAVGQAIPNPPDGSDPGPLPPSNPRSQTCGPLLSNTINTDSSPSLTSNTAFSVLPGAAIPVTVPEGAKRCVKVLFTAETACEVTGAPDFCYVRAMANNVPLDPVGGGFQAIDSEDGTASGHAYEWVGELGPGNYTIHLDRRVLNAATTFWTDDWTFDVEVHLA